MLKITTKTFKELTTDELYALLQLRSEVFVVEQDCVYQDIDYKGVLQEKLVMASIIILDLKRIVYLKLNAITFQKRFHL